MKDKEQILWEERQILKKLLRNRPFLLLETDLIIHSVSVNYLISEHERNIKFAIIREGNQYERETLEEAGIRTFQTNYAEENTINFLLSYIFKQ